MELDENYIRVAVSSLKLLIGKTFPNPPVFSILVESNNNFSDNKIVSFGSTGFTGRPHAEFNAIDKFNFKRNKKYSLYSTLEPCCHHGRAESCVTKIINSKFIKRVIFCVIDPDLRVNGKGKKKLLDHKIEVIDHFANDEIFEIYKGYFLNRKIQRPRIYLKLATSMDGYISKKNIKTKITNKFSDAFSQILRSQMDAILVGSNTVKIDNCRLTSRQKGLQKFSPIRILLNKKLDINLSSKIFKDCEKHKTIIFTDSKDTKKIARFSEKNVEVITLKKGHYNLSNILKRISKYGICNLLVEGGAKIFTSFLKENMFDDVYIFRSSFFIGCKGLNATGTNNIDFSKIKLKRKKFSTFGDNTLEILTKK